MASVDGIREVLRDRLPESSFGLKALKFGFYAFLILLVAFLIMVILSLTYADSYDPMSLFFAKDRTFSYSGAPLSVTLYSDTDNYVYCDSVGNGTIMVSGNSVIDLYPEGDIMLVSPDGTSSSIEGHVSLVSSGLASYYLTVSPLKGYSDDFNNTHLYFSDANLSLERRGFNYNLILTSDGSPASYDNIFVTIPGAAPVYSFDHLIHIAGGSLYLDDSGRIKELKGDIMYRGTIGVKASDYMLTFIPINESETMVAVDSMTVRMTDGSLVIGGKVYPCFGADNMYVESSDDSILSLVKQGKVNVIGKADSLTFRGQEYASQPVKVFMRDGYFTLATSILTAALALVTRRMFGTIRGK